MQSPRSPSGHTESLTHAQRTRSPEPKFTRRSTLTNGARKAEADAIPGDADLGTHSGYQRHVARTVRHPRLFRCTCLDSFGTSLAGTGLGRPCPRLGPNVRVRPPPRVRGPSGKTAPKAKRPGDQERGSWTLLWGFGGSQAAGVGLFWGPGRDSGPAKLWGSASGPPDSHVCILFRQVSAWRRTEIIRVPSAQQRARHPCADCRQMGGRAPRWSCAASALLIEAAPALPHALRTSSGPPARLLLPPGHHLASSGPSHPSPVTPGPPASFRLGRPDTTRAWRGTSPRTALGGEVRPKS